MYLMPVVVKSNEVKVIVLTRLITAFDIV